MPRSLELCRLLQQTSMADKAIQHLRGLSPSIAMVQPTQPRNGNHLRVAFQPVLYRTPVRRVLFQLVVKPILLMVVHVITHDPS